MRHMLVIHMLFRNAVVAVCSVVYCFLSTSCRCASQRASCARLCTSLSVVSVCFSDRGIVPYWEEPQGADWRRLTKCESWVPKSIGSVGYCEEGQVIVKEYDHFCIWTGMFAETSRNNCLSEHVSCRSNDQFWCAGTAIGAGNMFCFMCMLKGIVCLLMYVVFLANLHSLGIA